jgi:hypoxanthine-DNA glycosylase
MIETHPFGNFVPPKARYLILGSFTGRQAVKGKSFTEESYDWFYGRKQNQFWPIIEAVYGRALPDKASRQKLLAGLGIAMADIIYQCERRESNNLDNSLTNIVYNGKLAELLDKNKLRKIFFSSRFVEAKFKQAFKGAISAHPEIELVTLPSPSPRYARMTKEEKIRKYRELLPKR